MVYLLVSINGDGSKELEAIESLGNVVAVDILEKNINHDVLANIQKHRFMNRLKHFILEEENKQ